MKEKQDRKLHVTNILRNIIGAIKMFAFIVGTILLVLMHTVWYLLTRRLDITMLFHKWCCFVMNIHTTINGQSAHTNNKPVIYLVNHISYIDILVLGSYIDGCFVAKSEVAGWPGFGFLAKLQKTIFIVREKSALMASRDSIASAMLKGHDIILFPEGTSTDGWSVLQFRAGLLGIFFPDNKKNVEAEPVIDDALVQPLAIKHVKTDGVIVTRDRQDLRDLYAWYGDMELVPHLWSVFKTWRTDVELHYLDPLSSKDFVHRFDIANAAQEKVLKVIESNITDENK
jgi:1-acyl-sn-glycerol-3-phosphate acyltransferase